MMNRLCWLLGDDPIYMQMGNRFKAGSASDRAWEIAILVGLIVGVIVVVWTWNRYVHARNRWIATSPVSLFKTLCRAHQLTRRDRLCLAQLVRRQQLPHLAAVFVDPTCFSSEILESFGESQQTRLKAIRDKLFGVVPSANF